MIAGRRVGAERRVPALTFATMKREDLVMVLDIERQSFPHPWSAEFFLQELRLPFSRVVLARASEDPDRRLLGYVCRWLTAGELHLLNVAVHPQWRRCAVGRRLVEHVLAEAHRTQAERAVLEVRSRNQPAIALYEQLGFRQIGLRRSYYGPGEDALVMELGIDHERN